MRWLAIFSLVFIFAPALRAQRQEPSLVDRLLRPNMELQNGAQGKKYTSSSAVVERRGTVGTFYLKPNRTEKSFAALRTQPTAQYSGRPFNAAARSVIATQVQNANKPAPIQTTLARDVHAVHDANNAVTGREFAAQQPFSERGKSQKSLDRQNPPLNIDQVRELLNKNK